MANSSDAQAVKDAGVPDDAAVREGLPGAADKRAAARQASSDEPTFTRDRLLSSEGALISGQPDYLLAGALHDDDRDSFTRAEIADLIDTYERRDEVKD